jgi:hypothetical protein
MKHFDDLTPEQQEKAIETEAAKLLQAIVEGAVRFSDELNSDGLQAAIDEAIAEAKAMQTPWFAGEYIMHTHYNPGAGHITSDDGLWPVAEAIRSMAAPVAEDAVYLEAGEHAIPLAEIE